METPYCTILNYSNFLISVGGWGERSPPPTRSGVQGLLDTHRRKIKGLHFPVLGEAEALSWLLVALADEVCEGHLFLLWQGDAGLSRRQRRFKSAWGRQKFQ